MFDIECLFGILYCRLQVSNIHLGSLVLLLLVVTLASLLLEGAALLQHDDAGVPQLARPAVTCVALISDTCSAV